MLYLPVCIVDVRLEMTSSYYSLYSVDDGTLNFLQISVVADDLGSTPIGNLVISSFVLYRPRSIISSSRE